MTLRISLLFLSVFLTGCESNKDNAVNLKFYLKKNSGETLPLADIDVFLVSPSTLQKALSFRSSIRTDYCPQLVSDDLVTQLKKKDYKGPWHPEEIDRVEPVLDAMARTLGGMKNEVYRSAAIREITNSGSAGSNTYELKQDFPETKIGKISFNLKADNYARKAKEAGKSVYKLFIEESEINTTNISGDISMNIQDGSFVVASTIVENHIVAWIIPSSSIEQDNFEITGKQSFILKFIPSTALGLLEESPSLKFWFQGTLITKNNALEALLVSDEFYTAAKTAMQDLRSEDWHMKYGD